MTAKSVDPVEVGPMMESQEHTTPVRIVIGDSVREVRRKKHMTVFELARRSKLDSTVIVEFEAGTRELSFEELEQLQDGLGQDGARLLAKAVTRRVSQDPKFREIAIRGMDQFISQLERSLRTGEPPSSTEPLQ